jgi:hypothetical protein
MIMKRSGGFGFVLCFESDQEVSRVSGRDGGLAPEDAEALGRVTGLARRGVRENEFETAR